MSTQSAEIDSRMAVQCYPEPPPMTETAWQSWWAQNRVDERRGGQRYIAIITLISIALLLTLAALWAFVAPYERALIAAIALGASALMFRELDEETLYATQDNR